MLSIHLFTGLSAGLIYYMVCCFYIFCRFSTCSLHFFPFVFIHLFTWCTLHYSLMFLYVLLIRNDSLGIVLCAFIWTLLTFWFTFLLSALVSAAYFTIGLSAVLFILIFLSASCICLFYSVSFNASPHFLFFCCWSYFLLYMLLSPAIPIPRYFVQLSIGFQSRLLNICNNRNISCEKSSCQMNFEIPECWPEAFSSDDVERNLVPKTFSLDLLLIHNQWTGISVYQFYVKSNNKLMLIILSFHILTTYPKK